MLGMSLDTLMVTLRLVRPRRMAESCIPILRNGRPARLCDAIAPPSPHIHTREWGSKRRTCSGRSRMHNSQIKRSKAKSSPLEHLHDFNE